MLGTRPVTESVGSSRRRFLVGTAIGAGAAATAMVPGCFPPPPAEDNIDADVLNFALNLEYLEAEFYLRAIGLTLSAAEAGAGAGGVAGGNAVPFESDAIRQYANEIAADERAHVNVLRTALAGAAVPRPAINLQESFSAAAQAAGLIAPGETFDAFANETNFLLAAYIFEDVGVTAYRGGAPLLTDKLVLATAAGLLGAEAYHAATLRTVLYSRGAEARNAANAISNARDLLDGPIDLDQGVELAGAANIVPTDVGGLVFGRTPAEVLRIVYLNPLAGVSSGGFFPNGLNGAIRTT